MKTYLNCCAVILFAFSVASCGRQAASVSTPVKDAILPQANFVKLPIFNNGSLKTEISFSKPLNQNMTFAVGLQTLSVSKDQIDVNDVDTLVSHGEFRSTSTEATFAKVGAISFNEDLKRHGFSKQYKGKVRLKITMAQAGSTPDTWQQAKARIVFSKWLDYK